MNTRDRAFAELIRGLAALAALVGLIVGVPAALLALAGWPLPQSLPSGTAIVHALSQSQVSDATIVKGAALVCWLAWLVLVLCVVVEATAWVAGRTAARLPIVGPFQVWAGRLVATALLLFSSFGGLVRPASAASMARPAPAVVAQQRGHLRAVQAGATSPEEAAVAARPALPEPAGAKRYVVEPPDGRRRDTLWGIAERHLGNPERWPEIFELNKDRFTGGHRVTNPHWIYPGEELVMPADAVGVTGATPAAPVAPAAPAAPANTPASAQDSPAQMRVVPENDADAHPDAAGKSAGWRVAHDVTELLPADPTGLALGGAGVFAAGLVAAVERRRRAQRRRYRPGRPLLLPEPELAGLELAARVAAEPEGAELVEVALQLLVSRAPSAPDVLGLRVDPRRVELAFASGVDVPQSPFRLVAGGRWMLASRLVGRDLRAEAAERPVVMPPFVTLGQDEDDREVLLNLRAAGLTAIVGDRSVALDVLHAAATELANRPWDQPVDIALLGFGDSLAGMPGVRTVASPEEMSRGLGPDTVVLSSVPVDHLPAGITTLVAGATVHAGCTITIADGCLSVDRLGISVRRPDLSADDTVALARLLTPPDAPDDEEEDVQPPAPPAAVAQPQPSEPTPDAEPAPAAADVEVRILGPVEIVGGEKVLTRAKSIELVAYLAIHRSSVVDADRLREALWPGRPPGTTLYTTASVARNHLGKSADGSPHFPMLPGGERVYKLADSVGTDYERFTEGVRRARSQAPADARRSLRAALELVRGRPFDVTTRGWEWTYVDGFMSMIENEIATAAHELARLCLEAGDAEGARWATRQGLRASPGNEQLFRDEMFAADLEGNRAGVESVLTELKHVVEDDAPLDALHPETVAVYKRLTSGERLAPTG